MNKELDDTKKKAKEPIRFYRMQLCQRNCLHPSWELDDCCERCLVEQILSLETDTCRIAVVKKKAELLDSGILTLWDSYTQDMERIYGLLMQGKSELAAIILQERMALHNGQSRETLINMLAKHFVQEVVDG